MIVGVLRLRIPFALRTEYFAQDDREKLLDKKKGRDFHRGLF
jgi:hypothetical protein